MIRLKTIGLAGSFMLLALTSLAQNERDAFLLSQEEITGSARTVAMGGAFNALGGDISGAYLNPAGIGVFRNNTFSIGMGFHTNITNSDYYSNGRLDSKSNLNIPNLGIVGVFDSENSSSKWRSTAMAFGIHRNMSFHRRYSIYAQDVPSSLIDSYQKTLLDNGTPPSQLGSAYPFDIFLAWQTYVLDTIGSQNYYNAAGVLPVDQSYEATERGSKRETFFAFGSNYDDKLYIGGNLIFSRIQYERDYVHSEQIDPTDSTTVLREYAFDYSEDIDGLGIAFAGGLIYRPISPMRIGLSVKSPTFYSMDITYESGMVSTFTESRVFEQASPYIGEYAYRMTSPFKASAGMAYVIGKKGMVSADVDYLYYRSIRMRGISDGYNFGKEEQSLQDALHPTINMRFGAEYRVSQTFSLRGGFAHFANPYNRDYLESAGFNQYSAGFGYRTDEFFVDAAYQVTQSESVKFLYDPSLVDGANISDVDHRLTATVGFRF